jgi:hypothetical protein
MITLSIAITLIRIVITTLAVMTTMITMAPHYRKLDGSKITVNNIGHDERYIMPNPHLFHLVIILFYNDRKNLA